MKSRAFLAAAILVSAFAHGHLAGQTPQPKGPLVFMAIYERGPSWIAGQPITRQPNVRDHIKYYYALGDRLIGGGPLRGDASERIDGIIMFQAASADEAREWLAKDPLVTSGVAIGRIVEWMLPAPLKCG